MSLVRTIRELGDEIEAFLIFGPEESEISLQNQEGRQEVLRTIQSYETKHASIQQSQTILVQKLQEKQQKAQLVQNALQKFHTEQFLPKYEQCLLTQYKLQLFTLMKLMNELDQCQAIESMPNIILSITSNMPKGLHDRSRTKARIITILEKKKKSILEKFYSFFENHFQKVDQQEQLLQGEDNEAYEMIGMDAQTSSSSSWESFLKQSQQWLLTYTLLSILLPILLQQSKQSILEHFKEALDQALTPLWGRFYYHLSLSIEIQSRRQILWTFYYSKSFIEMLFQLILQITAAQSLSQLCNEINYLVAAEEQVTEKAMKFLKAHIASIFVVELLPSISSLSVPVILNEKAEKEDWDRVFGMQVIEEVLALDAWLFDYLRSSSAAHASAALASSSSSTTAASVSYYQGFAEVIYDCKEVFHHWLFEERGLVLQRLQEQTLGEEAYRSLERGAAAAAGDEIIRLVAPSHQSSDDASSVSNSHSSSLQCYSCIYHSLSLFLLLQERYSYFPLNAQSLLSEVILEPLLAYLLSLLLYRIRNHALLYSISINTFINRYPENQDLQEYQLFQQTVHYLEIACQTQLLHFAQTQQRWMIGNTERCRKKWTILQNWIPKILITKEQQVAGFTRQQLLQTAFKISKERFSPVPSPSPSSSSSSGTVSASSWTFPYRSVTQHPLTKTLQQQGHLQRREEKRAASSSAAIAIAGGGGSSSSSTLPQSLEDEDLSECVYFILELAKTLVNVLDKHFNE